MRARAGLEPGKAEFALLKARAEKSASLVDVTLPSFRDAGRRA